MGSPTERRTTRGGGGARRSASFPPLLLLAAAAASAAFLSPTSDASSSVAPPPPSAAVRKFPSTKWNVVPVRRHRRRRHRNGVAVADEPPTTLSPPSPAVDSSDDEDESFRSPSTSATTAAEDDAVAEKAAAGAGTASVRSHVFNLAKSIAGAGVLGLPAGIAAFGDAPSALFPSLALVCLVGVASAYGFSLVGRVCSRTDATSYRSAWEKSVGRSTSWIPASCCLLVTSCSNLSYGMILADAVKDLLSSIGIRTTRSNALYGVTLTALLPLCLKKDLSSLAPFSLLGILGMGCTALCMAVRYFDGSYALPDGRFVRDLDAKFRPSFGDRGASSVLNPKAFALVSMLSTAYMAHYNAPKFYVELENNTIPRYNRVIKTSFGIAMAILAAVASLGFLTFGSNSAGFILNNYSTNDGAMSLSRLAVAISIVFSYPLCFAGVRDGVLDLLRIPSSRRTDRLSDELTLILLAALTYAALRVKDLSTVFSFGGATWGTAVIYVLPSIMYGRAVLQNAGNDDDEQRIRNEVRKAAACGGTGVVMGAIGTFVAIRKMK